MSLSDIGKHLLKCLVIFSLGASMGLMVVFGWKMATCCNDAVEFSPTYQGTWRSIEKDAAFEATISNDAIEIVWANNASRPLYWKGDFTSAIPSIEPVVKSRGDVKAMTASLLASTDAEKFFTYRDEKLSFRMTIAGVATTIYMKKV